MRHPGGGGQREAEPKPVIKGPDDDEEFLWNLEKERFKQRRAQEAEEEKRRQRRNRGTDGEKD